MEKTTITGSKHVCSEHVSTTTTRTGTGGVQRDTQDPFLSESRELARRKAESTWEKRKKGKKMKTPEVSVETAKQISSYAQSVLGSSRKSEGFLGKMVTLLAPFPSTKAKAEAIAYPSYLQNELLQQGNRALEGERSQEARGYYEKALREAIEGDIALQFFCIKGIGDCLLIDRAYHDAAWYYNYALALCEIPSGRLGQERGALLKALKAIEKSYIKEVVKYEGSIREDSLDIEKRRKKLTQVRMVAKQKLDAGVPAGEIQTELTEGFKAFVCELIKDCFAVLPETPCEYAIMGLGSMSRNEMCFYSDLEFAVLLDERKKGDWEFFAECKNYFVRFTKLLELKMINLGESLNEDEIKKRNLPENIFNIVVSGLALDGKGSPLDRESLLMDVPERMAKIQGGERSDIIHVSLLEAVCYVHGNRTLVDRYEKAVREIFDAEDPFESSRPFREVEALTLLNRGSVLLDPEETVLRRFAPKLGEKLLETDSTLPFLNIKQDLYRFPSEAVSKLCMYYGIEINGRSTLERLTPLREKGIINEDCYEKLCETMKKVMWLRLRTHDHYKREDERAYRPEDLRVVQNQAYFKLESTRSVIDIYQVLIPLYEALKNFCEKNGEKRVEVASFNKMGAVAEGFVYEKLRDYGEAEKHYREVLFISKENVKARIGLGQVLYAQGKYEEAKKCYEETQRKLKKSKRKEHSDVIKVLRGLGLVARALGNEKKVVAYYQEALRVHKKAYEEDNHFSRAEILRDLGGSLNAIGERSAAVQAYREALKIYEKASVVDDTMTNLKKIEVLNVIIELTEDLKELVKLYEKVVLLKKACYGEGHLSVVESLKKFGDLCSALGERSERMRAIALYGKILDIYETSAYSKEELESVLDAFENVFRDLGREKGIKELYRQTFGLIEVSEEERAVSFNKLGEIWKSFGEKEKAVKKYEQALSIFEGYYGKKKIYGSKSISVGSAWYNLGMAYRDMGRNREAAKLLEQSVRIYEGSYGMEDFEMANVLAGWGGVLEKLSEDKKVKRLKKKVAKIYRVLSEDTRFQEAVWMLLKNDPEEKQLNLRGNYIDDEGAKIIARAIEKTPQVFLQQLYLGRNRIGDEGAQALALVLKKNQMLQQLDLSQNRIREIGAIALIQALETNQSLRELNLKDNQIEIGDVEVQVLAAAFTDNKTLQQLNLSGNNISTAGTQALALVLEKNQMLQQLDLSQNRIQEIGAIALIQALETNQSLRELNLKDNQIGSVGAEAWVRAIEANQVCRIISDISENKILRKAVEMLLQNDPAQRKLDLIEKAIGDVEVQVLAAALTKNKTLQQLNLSGNKIGTAGAKALALVLEKNQMLQQLDLSQNRIREIGAIALIHALEINQSLRELNLEDNQIGSVGAEAWVKAIEGNQVCRIISDISENKIFREAVEMLLRNDPVQRKLDLIGKVIGDAKVQVLAAVLTKNKTLQQLNLSGNNIGTAGAQALALVLEKNQMLQQLDLSQNRIQEIGAIELIHALETNQSLRELNLKDNQIGSVGAEAWAKAIEGNQVCRIISDISENKIFREAVEMLLRNDPVQRKLDLIGKAIGDVEVQVLAAALKKNKTLQQLNLSGNDIGTAGAQALALVLEKNQMLQQLDLSQNRIREIGAIALIQVLETNQRLRELNLKDNQIEISDVAVQVLAAALKKNKTLQQLNLSGNDIGTAGAQALALVLEKNQVLQQLDLSQNRIREIGAIALIQALETNQRLRELNLKDNQIGSVGAEAWARAIEANQVCRIISDISENKILREAVRMLLQNDPVQRKLDLIGKAIGDVEVQVLAAALTKNKVLQQLYLTANQIGRKGAKAIAHALEITPQIRLQQLGFGGNAIGSEGARAIAQAIKKTSQIALQQLDLSNNAMGAEGARAIAQAIKKTPQIALQQLDLSKNAIGAEGAKAIAQAIETTAQIALQQLGFGDNAMGAEGAKAIAQAIEKTPQILLQQLDLSKNTIGAEGAKAIAQAIENTPQIPLQQLDLSKNTIGADGAKAIAWAIEKTPQIPLQKLNLSWNQIGAEGAKAIAQAIEKTPQIPLQKLNLSWNQIGAEGANAIVHVLETTPQISLQQLNLNRNQIGDEGAHAIAHALEITPSIPLQQLYLWNNQIGDEGAHAIAHALETTPQIHLQLLDLNRNQISAEGAKVLQQAKAKSRTFRELWL